MNTGAAFVTSRSTDLLAREIALRQRALRKDRLAERAEIPPAQSELWRGGTSGAAPVTHGYFDFYAETGFLFAADPSEFELVGDAC